MATNDFLPFAAAGGANVLSQADWLALAARLSGYTAGVANSAQINKGLRQAAAMSAMLGQFINTYGGLDALDNADIAALLANFAATIRAQKPNYVTTVGGTANSLTATLDPPQTDHRAGLILRLYPSATNTGPVTFNAGAGSLPLRYVTGADLFPGEIVPGRVIEILSLGGIWVLLNPVEYFERLTPKRARQTSAFTPNVVISDISGVDTANIVQTVTVSGVTYLDVTASLAIRNTVSTLVDVIAYTRLQRSGYPDQDGQYLGCQSANNIQIPMTIRTIYRGLDPTATYALRLIAQKGAAVGPVGVLDTYASATSD